MSFGTRVSSLANFGGQEFLANRKMITRQLLGKGMLVMVLVAGLILLLINLPGPGDETTGPAYSQVVESSIAGPESSSKPGVAENDGPHSAPIDQPPLAADIAVVAPAQEDSDRAQAATSVSAGSDREIDDDPVLLPISGWVLDQAGDLTHQDRDQQQQADHGQGEEYQCDQGRRHGTRQAETLEAIAQGIQQIGHGHAGDEG